MGAEWSCTKSLSGAAGEALIGRTGFEPVAFTLKG